MDPYQPWLSKEKRDPFEPWVSQQDRDLDAWQGRKLVLTLVGAGSWFGAIAWQVHLGQDVLRTGYVEPNQQATAAVQYRGSTIWVPQAQATQFHISEGLVLVATLVFWGSFAVSQYLRRRRARK
ncbi:hypothetical protein LF41_1440 [Lysobacter dokdonensis DS-58]|uniref:Transmembrane protein n=1 Tax=Lysobacter dokdonensis DS-58 TaxID=1300345 RepID=A0A0A2WD26_9GAMM|nr:hypothetical protein [Lysobacter dokdonensis]KGQ18086.1 hypothetical protein LF41_1440 [Lysobacter dokdonensis DS-58]